MDFGGYARTAQGGSAFDPWRRNDSPGETSSNRNPKVGPTHPPTISGLRPAPTHSLPGYQHPCLSSSKRPTLTSRSSVSHGRLTACTAAAHFSLSQMKSTYNDHWCGRPGYRSLGPSIQGSEAFLEDPKNALSLQSLFRPHFHNRFRGCQNFFFGLGRNLLQRGVATVHTTADGKVCGDRPFWGSHQEANRALKFYFPVTYGEFQASEYI